MRAPVATKRRIAHMEHGAVHPMPSGGMGRETGGCWLWSMDGIMVCSSSRARCRSGRRIDISQLRRKQPFSYVTNLNYVSRILSSTMTQS